MTNGMMVSTCPNACVRLSVAALTAHSLTLFYVLSRVTERVNRIVTAIFADQPLNLTKDDAVAVNTMDPYYCYQPVFWAIAFRAFGVASVGYLCRSLCVSACVSLY